jgi:hypothetical protein
VAGSRGLPPRDAVRCVAEFTAKYSPQEREWANQLLQDVIAERRQHGEC